jgi:hypothetical protein
LKEIVQPVITAQQELVLNSQQHFVIEVIIAQQEVVQLQFDQEVLTRMLQDKDTAEHVLQVTHVQLEPLLLKLIHVAQVNIALPVNQLKQFVLPALTIQALLKKH